MGLMGLVSGRWFTKRLIVSMQRLIDEKIQNWPSRQGMRPRKGPFLYGQKRKAKVPLFIHVRKSLSEMCRGHEMHDTVFDN